MAARPAYAVTYLKIHCKAVVQFRGWLGILKDDYVYAAMGYQDAEGRKDFLHQ